jgi:predicted dehydrogenase
LGEVSWVIAVPNPVVSHPPGDVSVDAIMGFVSGAKATLQSLEAQDYSIFDIRLYGRRGSLVLRRFGYEIERMGVVSRSDVSGYNELDAVGKKSEGGPRSFMAFMANHVADCLDGLDHPVSRGEDGLAALQVLLALRDSAARGGVKVDLSSRSWLS